ncbi:hypothetical protein BDV26DRAFT_259680 [Aspergillus bertholletiae]|uniref:Uncharacterized protein n=1 Tax=Aspergillus bertholletiae TaxID=1226010 RepID=A0A5N7BC79_9EURO|nr:hypothetical protein BDV26DRAFT_259680 [Aspergillus bertholletiae]
MSLTSSVNKSSAKYKVFFFSSISWLVSTTSDDVSERNMPWALVPLLNLLAIYIYFIHCDWKGRRTELSGPP